MRKEVITMKKWYSVELPMAQGNAFLAFLKDTGRTCDSAGIEGGYKLVSVYTTADDVTFLNNALQNMV